jgi:hypothetical protein
LPGKISGGMQYKKLRPEPFTIKKGQFRGRTRSNAILQEHLTCSGWQNAAARALHIVDGPITFFSQRAPSDYALNTSDQSA